MAFTITEPGPNVKRTIGVTYQALKRYVLPGEDLSQPNLETPVEISSEQPLRCLFVIRF